jgi:hypothetical protein
MKKNVSISVFVFMVFALCIFLTPSSHGQVAMKLLMSRKNYLQYEPVYAKIVMRNDSGRPLAFGHDKKLRGKLLFEITRHDGTVASRISKDSPSVIGTLLRPGEVKEFVVPVSDFYDLNDLGRYRIVAYVSHASMKKQYQSNEHGFTIKPGVLLWSRTVGVPSYVAGDHQAKKIKTVTYKIKSLHDGRRKVIYMSVEDDKVIYSVKKIGYEMADTMPACETDSFSRLHLLLRSTPKVYGYFVYNLKGTLEQRAVYKTTNTIPVLVHSDKTGTVIVAGGTKATKDVDYKSGTDKPF